MAAIFMWHLAHPCDIQFNLKLFCVNDKMYKPTENRHEMKVCGHGEAPRVTRL